VWRNPPDCVEAQMNNDRKTLDRALAMARRALAMLEEQLAGFGALHAPVHLQIEVEEKRRQIAELEARLGGADPAHSATPSAFDQRGQTVGSQTNIIVSGSGAVAVGDGAVAAGAGGIAVGGSVVGSAAPPANAPDLAPSPEATRLRHILKSRLTLEELRTVCFDLGVNFDDLGGEGLDGRARQLVLFLQKRNALPRLVEWLRRERPDVAS
jgi:hypothetical protein